MDVDWHYSFLVVFIAGIATCLSVTGLLIVIFRPLKPVQLEKKQKEDPDLALMRDIINAGTIEPLLAEELKREIEKAGGHVEDKCWNEVEENIIHIFEDEKKRNKNIKALLKRRNEIITWVNKNIIRLKLRIVDKQKNIGQALRSYNVVKTAIAFYLRRVSPFHRGGLHEVDQEYKRLAPELAALRLNVHRLLKEIVALGQNISNLLSFDKLKKMTDTQLENMEEVAKNTTTKAYYWLRSVKKKERDITKLQKNLIKCVRQQKDIIRTNGLRPGDTGLVPGY